MLTAAAYDPHDLDRLARLLVRYTAQHPHAKVMSAEFYTYHPAGRQAVALYRSSGFAVTDTEVLLGMDLIPSVEPTIPRRKETD